MINKTSGIFLMLLAFVGITRAQTLPFRNYSIEQGLSEAVVNALMQDHEGYIWVATSYGLNRFDGIDFQNFYEEDGLLNNKVYALYEDDAHRIWVGTGSGVNVIEDDSIRTRPELKPLLGTTVSDIYQDKSDEFWFATNGHGVWHWDREGQLTQYTSANGLADDRVHAIARHNQTLWFATADGLTRLKGGNFRTFTTKNGLPNNTINDVKVDSLGRVWAATRGGLSLFENGSFINFTQKDGLINNRIQSISPDAGGGLWLGTEGGVSHFKDEHFSNFSTKQGLTNNKIYATLYDREHNVWLGTYGSGVSLFLGRQFENFTVDQGLPSKFITDITQGPNGAMWITTFGGLVKYQDHKLTTYDEKKGLVNNNAYTVYVNHNNHLLVGTEWGLSLFDGQHFTNYGPDELPYHQIKSITGSKNNPGEYWLGTYGKGLLRYENRKFTKYSKANGLSNNTILAVENGPEGDIWVASYGGVSRFEDGHFKNYTVKQGLPNNGVIDILVTDDGQIWVSTFGGIAHYDQQSDSFEAITDEDGLPDKLGYFIQQDDSGIFWIGAKKGVIRFDYSAYQKSTTAPEKRQSFELITQQQGLVANEMNAGAGYKDKSGRLWFGTVGGLTVFDPKLADTSRIPPKIHIESVMLSGQTLSAGGHPNVKSSSRNITLNYLGINFTAPDQVKYEYRLKGSGEDWQQTYQRSVRYSSLFPGDYTFEVKARNSGGLWSMETATLSFTVLAPFWLQWWFITLIILILLGIMFLIYRFYRIRKMVDIERMRVRIASDLHDDVGSSLTEIALQSDFLQTTDASQELKDSLSSIGEQSRRIVSSLDDIVWSIDARNDTVGDLTDRMQDYINNILSDREVLYHFDTLDMNRELSVSTKENLYLIFKEAINNVAKHSNATRVEVYLATNGNSFKLTIDDNGTQMAPKRKTGHGLRNMKMRAQRINATVTFKEEDGFMVQVEGTY